MRTRNKMMYVQFIEVGIAKKSWGAVMQNLTRVGIVRELINAGLSFKRPLEIEIVLDQGTEMSGKILYQNKELGKWRANRGR